MASTSFDDRLTLLELDIVEMRIRLNYLKSITPVISDKQKRKFFNQWEKVYGAILLSDTIGR